MKRLVPVVPLVVLGLALGPVPAARADQQAPGVDRSDLLTKADWQAVYPDARGVNRITSHSGVFAPKGCDRQGAYVRGESRVASSISPGAKRESLLYASHHVVEMPTRKAARQLVERFRSFSEECVGNEQTDDGSGDEVVLKKRAWTPRSLGDESAGLVEGWVQRSYSDWTRVIAVRDGRRVSIIEATFADVRPAADGVVRAARKALARLR